MNRALYTTLGYDAVADFAPLLLVSFAFYMCVPNSSPAKSVQDFIAYAKEHRAPPTRRPVPARHHMAGELLKHLAGIEMTTCPSRLGAHMTSSPGASFASSGKVLDLIKSQPRYPAPSGSRSTPRPSVADRASRSPALVCVFLLSCEDAPPDIVQNDAEHGRRARQSGGASGSDLDTG